MECTESISRRDDGVPMCWGRRSSTLSIEDVLHLYGPAGVISEAALTLAHAEATEPDR